VINIYYLFFVLCKICVSSWSLHCGAVSEVLLLGSKICFRCVLCMDCVTHTGEIIFSSLYVAYLCILSTLQWSLMLGAFIVKFKSRFFTLFFQKWSITQEIGTDIRHKHKFQAWHEACLAVTYFSIPMDLLLFFFILVFLLLWRTYW
jgi:hypothetical protein